MIVKIRYLSCHLMMANFFLQELEFYWWPIAFILTYAVVDLYNCIYISVSSLVSARRHLLRTCNYMKWITLFIHFPSHKTFYIAFLISSGVRAWLSSTDSDIYVITVQFKARDWSERFLVNICHFCFVMFFHSESIHVECTSIFSMFSSFCTPEFFLMEIWILAKTA